MDIDGIKSQESTEEQNNRMRLARLLQTCPIPDNQILSNLGLFLGSKNLSRILFLNHIYKKIIDTQGVVIDFGTRWGQNMAVFSALRGMYEPFNRHRKIIGFDTFSGFPAVDPKDGSSDLMKAGNVTVSDGYCSYLGNIMECHENENPLSHINKHQIVVGDASKSILSYLDMNPHTIIALVYFDFDIYQPTKDCLLAIKDRLFKGSVIGFDELNDSDSPGETAALMETIGLNKIRLKRYRYASRVSYFVYE